GIGSIGTAAGAESASTAIAGDASLAGALIVVVVAVPEDRAMATRNIRTAPPSSQRRACVCDVRAPTSGSGKKDGGAGCLGAGQDSCSLAAAAASKAINHKRSS